MTPQILPHNQRIRKPSVVSAVMNSRQRTLEQLYLRRATLEMLIQSLEMYDRLSKAAASKVVALR